MSSRIPFFPGRPMFSNSVSASLLRAKLLPVLLRPATAFPGICSRSARTGILHRRSRRKRSWWGHQRLPVPGMRNAEGETSQEHGGKNVGGILGTDRSIPIKSKRLRMRGIRLIATARPARAKRAHGAAIDYCSAFEVREGSAHSVVTISMIVQHS